MEGWVEDLERFLESPVNCDNDSITSYLNNLSSLLEDKDPIELDLVGLKEDVKAGLCGLDYVKPFISDIVAFEKKLKATITRAMSMKNALSQNSIQLKTCEDNIDNVFDWIDCSNNIMKDIDHSSSIDEVDSKVNEFRTNLSDEQKAINSLREAKDVYSKLKAAAPKNLNGEPLKSRIENVEGLLKKATENQKAIDKSIKDFNKALGKANDYQKDFDKKLTGIGPTTNDINKLRQQLDKIEKLQKSQPEGDKIVEDVMEKRDIAFQLTSDLHPIQQKIISDTDNCTKQWHNNLEDLDHLKRDIISQLEKCEDVLESGNRIDGWLKEKENQLKCNKCPCDSIAQKEAQIENLKTLLEEVEIESPLLDKYFDDLEEMATTDPGSAKKLSATKQQRDALIQNIKNAIESAEEKVTTHEDFNKKLDAAEEWLDEAKALKEEALSKQKPDNVEELKRRMDIIDQLLNSKKNGEMLIKAAVASGECAAKDTASRGKEDILNVLRALNKDFIQVYDGLAATKQAIEAKLGKTASITKDLDNLDEWVEEFEHNFDNIKDGDLQTMKELIDDVQTKMHFADNLLNQAKTLDDKDLEQRAEEMRNGIKNDLENCQQKYGTMRENQRIYNDFLKGCSNIDNWINDVERKMSRCGELTSSSPDDMNLRLKSLEKLSDEIRTKKEDLEKINSQGNELSWSSPSKSGEINALLDKLNEKYHHLAENVETIDSSIKDDLKDQNDFDNAYQKANRWISDITQELLKCSDSKRYSPSTLMEFSRKIEDINDKVPTGDDIISSAIQIGQDHVDRLRRKSVQGMVSERDAKKVHELDKNWHDFKMQLDKVTKNAQTIKDNIGEFDQLRGKIEEFIDDKEKYLRNPTSTTNFKYILDEMQSFGQDIEKLQKKANEIGSSLSNSDAPSIAKELTERYENLKRTMETELGRAKRLEDDWVSYKNALNACEKWIVDTGFRIIDHDFSACSPEDAQVKLDECQFMCDEIRKFRSEVEKVIAIGRHVSEEIVQHKNSNTMDTLMPQHQESEIVTDIDHINNSYRNALENSVQTKGRLEEQLSKWRHYRDLVQDSDKYLTTDLVEWWRQKKYFAPQTVEDINRSIHQAEDILQDLTTRQSEMKLGKSNCQSVLIGSASRKSISGPDMRFANSATTPLSRLAFSVESGLEHNIEEIRKFIPKLEKTKQEWKQFDKDLEDLENWVKEKESIFETRVANNSQKFSSLNNDQRLEAEKLKRDIDSNQRNINQLLERAQILGKRQINPLLQKVEDLARNLKRLLERKDEEVDAVDFVKRKSFSCQNSMMPYNSSETISTQTPPETCTVSTSTFPTRKSRAISTDSRSSYGSSSTNGYGLRNSGGNHGLSKMLYPYCCTSDLLNEKMNLDFAHGSVLVSHRYDQRNGHQKPSKIISSKIRSGTDDSIRRNWMAANNRI